MNPFIWTKDNTLTSEFCNHCISKFESDDRKYNGCIGADENHEIRYDPNIKKSTDLNISSLSNWKDEDHTFYNVLYEEYYKYKDHLDSSLPWRPYTAKNEICDSGYQIQRTNPSEFYTWHNDADCTDGKIRVITFIWYLNTIIEDGYTEFWDGTKVQPEQGKMLMFPATWDFMHRGYPPKSETKYICTGWIHYQI